MRRQGGNEKGHRSPHTPVHHIKGKRLGDELVKFIAVVPSSICNVNFAGMPPRNDGTYGIQIVDAKYIAYQCKNNYDAYRKLIKVDMLGIDDLGTEPSEVMDYGNVYTPVIDLLTKRYEEQLFTVITTNLTPQQIRGHYGDRIADRLNEMVKKIVFNNGTYRTNISSI